jgi:protein SCO1/2
VFTPTAAALLLATGAGLFAYFRHEKEQAQARRAEELAARSVGRAHVGGPFALTTHDGAPYTEENLKGQWTLLYFGFTNCPDICPAELDKMGVVADAVGLFLYPLLDGVH